VDVDDAYHGHPVGLVMVDTLREVGHVVDLYERIDVKLNLIDVGLH
jgi:hypothetical protein